MWGDLACGVDCFCVALMLTNLAFRPLYLPSTVDSHASVASDVQQRGVIGTREMLADRGADNVDFCHQMTVHQPIVYQPKGYDLVVPIARLQLDHILLLGGHLLPVFVLPGGAVTHESVLLRIKEGRISRTDHSNERLLVNRPATWRPLDHSCLVPSHPHTPISSARMRALTPWRVACEAERLGDVALPQLCNNVLDHLLWRCCVVRTKLSHLI
mmetsp:Transcript_1306/g.2743  ORF Transcript_1306/g.2743 Transcript_1306/m.2743 type:complete len:214 (-) Transcript_1306:269-910(-)